MSQIYRTDHIPLDSKAKVVKHPDGYRSVLDAIVSRTGVFSYADGKGGIRREYRPPSEVGKQESLDSFAGVPMTNLHPRKLISPATAKANSCGSVGDKLYMCKSDTGKPVVRASRLNFHTQGALDSWRAGRSALSNGYKVHLDFTPGTSPEGEAYDCIQRSITGNHIALCDSGRAGPLASIPRCDGIQEWPQGTEPPSEGQAMDDHNKARMDAFVEGSGSRWRVRRGDAPFEVLSTFSNEEDAEAEKDRLHRRNDPRPQARDEAARRRFRAFQEERDDKMDQKERADTLERQLTEATSQLVSAQAQRDTYKAKLDETEKPTAPVERTDSADIRKRVQERMALERTATPHLDADFEFDKKEDIAIKRAVITKLQPKMKLDGRDDVYIEAAYDAVLELHTDAQHTNATAQARTSAMGAVTPASTDKPRMDAKGFARAFAAKQHGRPGIDRIKKEVN